MEAPQLVGEPICSIDSFKDDCLITGVIQEGLLLTEDVMLKALSLNDMPEEILEHILWFLSPYKDLDAAKLVSKQWYRIIKSLVAQCKRRFHQNLANCEVKWSLLTNDTICKASSEKKCSNISISDRHSHSATYYNGSMYIFGGCTSTNTTFNDLWRFDLGTRQWVRPVAMGTYPSPKACATMVVYNGNLVLFGGWSHPIPYPNPHQSAHYFSELHSYSPVTNRWTHILSIGQEPEALGGHSASVAGHLMVVFGGSPRTGMGSNNVWVFNFLKCSWKLQAVTHDVRPDPRYGQYQTTLDENHILIMGGSVGPSRVYNDMWLLTLHPTEPWTWSKITIQHPELMAPQSWCHAACRVKDVIVVVAKSNKLRQTRNIKPKTIRTCALGAAASGENCPQMSSNHLSNQNDSNSSPQPPNKANNSDEQKPLCSSNRSNNEDCQDDKANSSPNKSLLALQQKLHRECVNLADPDNHHHNPHGSDEAEGYFHRLNNRWGNEASPDPNYFHQQQSENSPHNYNQPEQGTFQRRNQNVPANVRGRGAGFMPSIRPNAMCNRQKQLEALQRQEEILRSKSRALSAARNKKPVDVNQDVDLEENVPDIIPTKNKMDVHVVNISGVLTDEVAVCRPLSELQPPGAPTETICCSLLEGRGELILFGGAIRDVKASDGTNTAINKLYVLQPR
ncbi:RING finger protein B-like [Physella acuta]|uniref:RING finger protein B-like n=1 Tax=Physella acuta TaxID=109671 RepID=UPI0027DCBF09|nr:RING finger protein B-like [Physella acuta]XP_059143293.1 RING finger protein B-like [Physella acuta]XP_059143294.1 RING finger protein B-like [Physella acuta]